MRSMSNRNTHATGFCVALAPVETLNGVLDATRRHVRSGCQYMNWASDLADQANLLRRYHRLVSWTASWIKNKVCWLGGMLTAAAHFTFSQAPLLQSLFVVCGTIDHLFMYVCATLQQPCNPACFRCTSDHQTNVRPGADIKTSCHIACLRHSCTAHTPRHNLLPVPLPHCNACGTVILHAHAAA